MKKIAFLFLILALSHSCFGWGSKGHRIVAAIAKKCLEQRIVDSVDKYLNGMSWEEAACWMDEIRADHSYDHLKPWHYVNIPKDKTYVKGKQTNIIEEINTATQNIRGTYKSNVDVGFQLRVLFHLVGDIHQPLHCGYADDRGGNNVEVEFLGKKSNLHKVWDKELIDAAGIDLNYCLAFANELSEKQKKEIQTLDPEVWCKDSRSLLPFVYGFKNGKIDQTYVDDNKVFIVFQLVKAGIRLAKILTDILN